MKKIFIYILLLVVITALWYFSITFFIDKSGLPYLELVAENTFAAINSIFSVLALTTIVYIVVLLSIDIKFNQTNFEKTALSNKLHLEIIALSSLINECDTTLHRYDRWEKAGIKGDYTNAKADVREKMNAYRTKLEKTYEEIG